MQDDFLKFLNDYKDALGWLFGSGVVLAVLSGIYRLILWLIKEYRLRRIRTNENFPFKIILPNSNVAKEILGGADDDPLADRNIPYQQRIQGQNTRRELEELLEENRWILINGRTGLGKTREAVQLAQSLNNEGCTILYLTREAWLDAPAKLPNNIPERKLLFLLDDLNKKCHSSKAETRPNASESLTLSIYEPFQTRLQRTLEAFDTFCGKSEIRVIATARNEKTSEFDEPSEWNKLGWEKYDSLWEKFKLVDLPEPDKNAEERLLEETAENASIHIKSTELPTLVKRNDGTFRNLVENLSSSRTEGFALSAENFRDTLKGTWQKRYQRAIQKNPEAKYIYDAIELLRDIDIQIRYSTVLQVAGIISDNKLFEHIKLRWNYSSILKQLIKIENILHPRDGQIEAKGYRINVEKYLPSIYRQTYWSLARNKSSLSFGPQSIIGLITLSLAPKSIFLPSTKLGRLEKIYCSLLDLSTVIVEIAEHYARAGFELYAENLFLKLVEIADNGLLNRTVNRKYNSHTWRRLGYFYSRLDRFDDAVEAFNKAIELDPKSVYSWDGVGDAYREQRKYDDAIAAYQRAIEINPKLPYLWNGLGNTYRDQEKYEDAVISYQKAIGIDHHHVYSWSDMGNVFFSLGRHDDAIHAYNEAIKIDPKNLHARKSIGYFYRNLGRNDEAVKIFHESIKIAPTVAVLWNGLGISFYDLGHYDDAIKSYNKAIEIDSKEAVYWGNLGILYLIQRKNDAAIEALRKSIEINPRYSYSLLSLAVCHKMTGNYPYAQKLISSAESAINNDLEYVQACFQVAKGNLEGGFLSLKKGLEKGQTSKIWAGKDPNFEIVRDNPRFRELVGLE